MQRVTEGLVLVVGCGAALIHEPDILVYADLARWEAQLRFRRNEASNLGVENRTLAASLQYKRAFFVDWRVCDRWKRPLMARWDFLLDTNNPREPKLAEGEAVRRGLRHAVTRPFRVVPFFDPAPWGGQWMKEVCDLDRGAKNYGWCFDCVPEENSLLLGFGAARVEIPSIDLVFDQPRALLGEAVHARFGDEFPIRFDFLDTMGGGNLSFQVHPLTEYIQQHFGMHYTQDESYYLLDAGPNASVYLGLREGVDRAAMQRDLETAQAWRRALSRRELCQPVAGQEARPFPHPGRHGALQRRQFDGARNQRHALHFHFQAVGLGAPRFGRQTSSDPSPARPCQTFNGTAPPNGRGATSSTALSLLAWAMAGARNAPVCTNASSSRRAVIGSQNPSRTTRAAGSTCSTLSKAKRRLSKAPPVPLSRLLSTTPRRSSCQPQWGRTRFARMGRRLAASAPR